MSAEAPLVAVSDVCVDYRLSSREWRSGKQVLRAVDKASFSIAHGETFALVGESGCGKTTLGRTLVRLLEPTSGSISFDGIDISALKGANLRHFRRRAQMIFQDPYTSLNPRMKVQEIVREPLRAHGVGGKDDQLRRVRELLDLVGLPSTSTNRFPHAFSGGQRQRIGIARALALEPELIVADEPISALDVSVQAQIVNLLVDLRDEFGLTLVFIAHDLAVVRHIATRVGVMYLGKLVELGPAHLVLERPLHPYSQALLSAVLMPDPRAERMRERIVLGGEVPSPVDPPSGCRFHTRCLHAMSECALVEPKFRQAGEGHFVACHLIDSPTAQEVQE